MKSSIDMYEVEDSNSLQVCEVACLCIISFNDNILNYWIYCSDSDFVMTVLKFKSQIGRRFGVQELMPN